MPRVKPPEPKRPDWIKIKLNNTDAYRDVKKLVKGLKLNTVCEEARCPNIFECWGREKTATFMVMGEICTRRCMFCSVDKGKPGYLDPDEPRHVGEAVAHLGLNHAVITQVNRDDLPDEGATHFAETIQAIREHKPDCRVEVLISDLNGNFDALDILLDAGPDVLAHNTECVERLYRRVRPQAVYGRTLELLKLAAEHRGTKIGATKSGIMVGLGETMPELIQLMKDLRKSDVDIFTVGQYLKPTKRHLPVQKYYTPEEFKEIYDIAMDLGFVYVESGPLVRSSYHANRASDAMEALLAESPFQKSAAFRQEKNRNSGLDSQVAVETELD